MTRKATGNKIGRPKRTALSQSQSSGLRLELAAYRANKTFPQASQLAIDAGVTPSAVSKWHKDKLYLAERSAGASRIDGEYIERAASQIITEIRKDREANEKPRSEAILRLVKNRQTYVESYVHKHWNGPTEWPGNEEAFQTPQDLINFLLENDHLPAELIKDELRRFPKPDKE